VKTVSIDNDTYKELVSLTGELMQEACEQISVSHMTRLAVAHLKSCLTHFPILKKEILDLISFEEPNLKYASIQEVTSDWFDKDFLEVAFGIKQIGDSDNSGKSSISELKKKGIAKIYGFHEERTYEAELTDDSKVKTLHDGKEYDSLSAAASAIRGYNENGWRFWKYRDEDGHYHPLRDLRDGESCEG